MVNIVSDHLSVEQESLTSLVQFAAPMSASRRNLPLQVGTHWQVAVFITLCVLNMPLDHWHCAARHGVSLLRFVAPMSASRPNLPLGTQARVSSPCVISHL